MESTTYSFKLRVVSPVHLGCDEFYEPTGFAVDEQAKKLISFEPASFLGMLEQEDLDKYATICRKGTVASLLEIYKFIRQHKEHAINCNSRQVAVSDAFVAHYTETLNLSPNAVQQQLNKFLMGRTAFQRRDSVPYIPGSALKGAIRTAVLSLRNNGKSYPKCHSGKKLNDDLAGGTFAKDPFRLIKVSDFQPAGDVEQRIVYAVNRKKKPSKKEARRPYQMLEVIEKGSEFIGTITVQQATAKTGIKQPVTFAEIHRALSGFYNREQQNEKSSLKSIGCDVTSSDTFPQGTTLIRVGRHSGAECVTVAGRRDIKIMQGSGKAKFKDHATTLWLAAGSDNPGSNKFLQPFGWSVLTMLSEEEAMDFEEKKITAFNVWETEQRQTIVDFKENAKLLAKQREEEEQKKQRRAEEQRIKDEELRKYPWRVFIPESLLSIADWGALKTKVLENEQYIQYQAEQEVGRAVAETVIRVAKSNRKTWDENRDLVVAEWLEASAIQWQPMAKGIAALPNPHKDSSALLEKINNLQKWSEYQADNSVKIPKLDKPCAEALRIKFIEWKLKKSKGKQQQKSFKALNKRLKNIE